MRRLKVRCRVKIITVAETDLPIYGVSVCQFCGVTYWDIDDDEFMCPECEKKVIERIDRLNDG